MPTVTVHRGVDIFNGVIEPGLLNAEIDYDSLSATGFRIVDNDDATDFVDIAASNVSYDFIDDRLFGTIEGAEFYQGGVLVATVSGLDWSLSAFDDAHHVAITSGDRAAFDAFFDSEDFIVDASGATGAVTLNGFGGDDSLVGGAFDDTLVSSDGTDSFDGGAGRDRVSYAEESIGAVVNLETGATSGSATGDNFVRVENLVGSSAADTFTGDDTANQLAGGDGDDTLIGGRGSDTLNGGDGDDVLDGGLSSGDTMNGGAGDDYIYGGYGNDIIDGGDGVDTVDYSGFGGQISVNLNGGGTTVGAGGDDSIVNVENVVGGDYADTLTATPGASRIEGGGGGDRMYGLGRDDVILGGDGNDIALGGAGNDTLLGHAGRDNLIGHEGDDQLNGGGDNDSLTGGAGDDQLTGGLGRDVLRGDDFTGGQAVTGGVDTFIFTQLADSRTGGQRDVIRDFVQGEDRIDLSAIDADIGASAADDAFSFIGASRFGGVAGELNYRSIGANTMISADVDGDARADFQILVNGAVDFEASDFVL